MRALTIWQPYAGLIVSGIKCVENRTWVPYLQPGTRIAIHAGARRDMESWEHCFDMRRDLDSKGQWNSIETPWPITFKGCPYSAIVGVATLDEVRRAPRGDDPWWVGPVGWYLRDPLPIEPIPCKGAQGLWTVPAEVEDKIQAVLRRVGPREKEA